MKLVFATNNLHKLEEIHNISTGIGIEIISLANIGFSGEIPETCDTLAGNAMQKADYIFSRYGMACFADDTGLEVTALLGAPGVYSARYAGEQCSYSDNVQKLLAEMSTHENRKACFKTVIAYKSTKHELFFEGYLWGDILTQSLGNNGFGYDPIFKPDGYEISYAQMESELKNNISHRYLAMQKFIDYIKKNKDYL